MLILTKNQIADAIEKAAADIERPGVWCQKDEAKDDTGIGVPTEDLTAIRFCASGMIEHNFARAHGFTNRDDMEQEELMDFVHRLARPNRSRLVGNRFRAECLPWFFRFCGKASESDYRFS